LKKKKKFLFANGSCAETGAAQPASLRARDLRGPAGRRRGPAVHRRAPT
jgi:hypothetical protein